MGRKSKTKEVREMSAKWRKDLKDITAQVEKYYPYIKNLIHVGHQLSLNINRWMYDPSIMNDEQGTILDMVNAMSVEQQNTYLRKYVNMSLNLREYQERVLVEYTKVADISNVVKNAGKNLKTEMDILKLMEDFTDKVVMPIQNVADELSDVVKYLKPIVEECEEGIVRSLGENFFVSIKELISTSEKVGDELIQSQIDTIRDLNLEEVLSSSDSQTDGTIETIEEDDSTVEEFSEALDAYIDSTSTEPTQVTEPTT